LARISHAISNKCIPNSLLHIESKADFHHSEPFSPSKDHMLVACLFVEPYSLLQLPRGLGGRVTTNERARAAPGRILISSLQSLIDVVPIAENDVGRTEIPEE
jgi:hypothetical protein